MPHPYTHGFVERRLANVPTYKCKMTHAMWVSMKKAREPKLTRCNYDNLVLVLVAFVLVLALFLARASYKAYHASTHTKNLGCSCRKLRISCLR